MLEGGARLSNFQIVRNGSFELFGARRHVGIGTVSRRNREVHAPIKSAESSEVVTMDKKGDVTKLNDAPLKSVLSENVTNKHF